MITTLNFSLFPSNELFTFGKGVITIVDEKKEQIPAIVPFAEKAGQSLTLFQSALERDKKSPFTLPLATADTKRDGSFYGLRTYVEATSYRDKDGWNEASTKILEIIRRHGWSAAFMGYKAETAAITNIISEIKTKCADELRLIGANEWLTDLETKQQAFEAVFHQSVTAAPHAGPTIIETRLTLVNSIRSLFSMITLLQTSTPSDELAALETSLNELITKSLSTVKAAATRAENNEGEDVSSESIN